MGTLRRNVKKQSQFSHKTGGCNDRAANRRLDAAELAGQNPLDVLDFVSGTKGVKQTRLTTRHNSFKQKRRLQLKTGNFKAKHN